MERTRVLIVEDLPLNRKLLRSLFRGHNCTLLEAEDAETGLTLALQELPDLILMDIQLPGMDGLEATRLLKKSTVTRHIPIVAVSAYAMAEDREAAFAAGCDGYLSKPIDTREFVRTVFAFLQAK